MREAGTAFLQEEARLRGGRPRLKAVIYPFDLDYGLAPGSGVYENTVYGGEPGKLALQEGYFTYGSWLSPVMQTFSPYLGVVVPSWEDQAGYMETRVYLRGAATPDEVAEQPFVTAAAGKEMGLAPYFQVKIEFQEEIRTWAVDDPSEADDFTAYGVDLGEGAGYESYAVAGVFPGFIASLRWEGRLVLPESEILDAGVIQVALARDFKELRPADHVLVLDNRRRQWLPRSPNFYFLGWPWEEKRLALYHGWELPDGTVEWLLVYQGVLERLSGMADGWGESRQVRLESQDWIAARLQRLIGVPDPAGLRRPFRRGASRSQGELYQTTPARVSEPLKTGSGSATLKVLGTFRGQTPRHYLLQAETTGEVGEATFRWSINQGQSWLGKEIVTAGPENPLELEEGLAVYWEAGPGSDLVAGDQWTFSAQPAVYHYKVFGGPFESITAVFLNGEETWDQVTADPATGVIQVSGRSAQVEARVVKDHTTHPVDIIRDVLHEVGLDQAIHQDSFDLAKSLTPEYAIGVCFENLTAAQAIREIVRRCLYELWVDFGEIQIRAFV